MRNVNLFNCCRLTTTLTGTNEKNRWRADTGFEIRKTNTGNASVTVGYLVACLTHWDQNTRKLYQRESESEMLLGNFLGQ